LDTAEVGAEVPVGRLVVAAAVVDVAMASSGVVGVAMVDVSMGEGVAVPVCKPPRKLPAATETPRSKRHRCIMLSAETLSKSGVIFCSMAVSSF
jgi:hypothetical protein